LVVSFAEHTSIHSVNRIALLGVALAALSTGCFNSQEIVTERAAREFRCPGGQVQTEELGGNAYRVWACGSSATYVCSPRMQMCMKEAGGSTAQAAPQPTTLTPDLAPTTAPFPTGTGATPTPTAPQPLPPPAPTAPNPWQP
jgi:hypothetical protein